MPPECRDPQPYTTKGRRSTKSTRSRRRKRRRRGRRRERNGVKHENKPTFLPGVSFFFFFPPLFLSFLLLSSLQRFCRQYPKNARAVSKAAVIGIKIPGFPLFPPHMHRSERKHPKVKFSSSLSCPYKACDQCVHREGLFFSFFIFWEGGHEGCGAQARSELSGSHSEGRSTCHRRSRGGHMLALR